MEKSLGGGRKAQGGEGQASESPRGFSQAAAGTVRGVRIEASSRIHGRLVIANMRLTVKERCSLFARIQSASWVRGGVILVAESQPVSLNLSSVA